MSSRDYTFPRTSDTATQAQELPHLYLGYGKKLWTSFKAIQEDYNDIVRLYREKVRQAKAQLELSLATAVKSNKKCFYKYISNKRRVN